ncbi:MarR family winged helix-turn-helix transcriptional regulator [Kiloniella laminariae]|uniref:MarR family winged helix-turn-helix transcriptional regulator n=1 Tax=Kiloniella laminariae TaxID=454162 RepID=UPI00037215BB|nr:MarR family transcriptional regulator [Kiloniella laminariae]
MTPSNHEIESLNLKDFFPYEVRIFYRAISQSVATIYTRAYGLTVYQWRVMVVLGNYPPLSASEVVDHSSLDKVQVSRAIKGLLKAGYLERGVSSADKRRVNLFLTREGRQVLSELIPQVRAREQEILAGLSPEEERLLRSLMARVRKNAEDCLSTEPFTSL